MKRKVLSEKNSTEIDERTVENAELKRARKKCQARTGVELIKVSITTDSDSTTTNRAIPGRIRSYTIILLIL